MYVGIILAPLACFFSIDGLRTVSFIAGICGTWYLLRLCREGLAAPFAKAMVASSLAVLTITLLPYLRLFYMEVSFLPSLLPAGAASDGVRPTSLAIVEPIWSLNSKA